MCMKTDRSSRRGVGAILLILLLALRPALAETPDDQYLNIYGIIEQGDALKAKGQRDQAVAKYREAEAALQSFEKGNRDWNPKLVAYRFKYLSDQIGTLSGAGATLGGSNAPSASPQEPSGSKPAPAAPKEQTKLIEPGAEPRQELRLHPKAGDKQTASITLKSTVDTSMAGMPGQQVKAPTMKISYEATVKSVADNGDIGYEVLIKDAGVPDETGALPQVVEPLKAALSGMQGLSGTGTVTSRGQSKGFDFKFPANASPTTRALVDQLKDAFVNITVSLPTEALGAGAKWERNEALKSQGATIDQTSDYELAPAEGEHMVIKSTVTQSAANQKVEVPAMQGMKLKLVKFTGKGTVTTTFGLGQLLPAEKVSELHTEQNLNMDAGGQPQALAIKTDMNLRIEAK